MDYDHFNQFCAALPATTYVQQWGDSHVWKVGGKVFAIGGWGENNQPAYTFKASNLNFEFLSQQAGYRPAPYLANRGLKWIQQIDTAGSLDDDLKYYLQSSYRMIALALSKRKQQALGIVLDQDH